MQIKIFLEEKYFHWITENAINELYCEGKLRRRRRRVGEQKLTFYFLPEFSYAEVSPKINLEIPLITKYFDISQMAGYHAEDLVEKALKKAGYIVVSKNSTYFQGKMWPYKEKGDLDFIAYGKFEDRWYGIQVKNKLRYPDPGDIYSFFDVNKYLGLTPWFIARMLPKTYIWNIIRSGGFVSLYPQGRWLLPENCKQLGEKIEQELGVPTLATDEPTPEMVRDLEKIKTLEPRRAKK